MRDGAPQPVARGTGSLAGCASPRRRMGTGMVVLGIETTCDETAAAVVERARERTRQDPVQRGAVADRPARGLRGRSAGDCGARPRRGARPGHRQGHERGAGDVRRPRRHRRRRRTRPDRRGDRGSHHRQGDRAGDRETAGRGQSSRGPRAHRPAHRSDAVPVLPVPRLRRPHPDRRGARGGRIRAARHHRRRRHRRSLRQDREAAGAGLPRRTAGREGSALRQSGALCAAAADDRTAARGFLALRAQDRAPGRGGEDRADQPRGRARSVRIVPAIDRRGDRRPPARRAQAVPRALRQADRAGRRRRRRRQSDDPQGAQQHGVRGRHHAGDAAAGIVHGQRRDDRMGRRGASRARPHRHARGRVRSHAGRSRTSSDRGRPRTASCRTSRPATRRRDGEAFTQASRPASAEADGTPQP